MAFVNKIGNLLKQSVSRHTNLELYASRTSLYQAIRSMSSSKLFVGGLSYATDETSLREAFSQYGEVIEARVILDRDTGRSRGFGFVSYTSTEEASSALNSLDGRDLHGRIIKVNYATEKRRGGFGGGYGSGGGFNFNGGDGGFPGGGGYGSGNYGGGDNYGTNNSYPGTGGNYGGGGGYATGEGGNYGGGVGQGSFGGGYGGGDSGNYNAGGYGTSLNTDQGTGSVSSDFTPDSEGSYRG